METRIIILFILVKYIGQMSTELPPRLWTRNDDLSNRMFAYPMFTTTTTRGRLQCATRCSERQCCRTMTFNLVTSVCIGYSGNININSTYTPNAGSECFQINNPQDTAFYSYDGNTNLCFSLKTDLQNHTGAADRCRQDNGDLMKIYTLEKLATVQPVLREYFNNVSVFTWIDGEDYTKTNSYIMGNGEAVPLTGDLWVPDEPNSPDEGCCGLYFEYKLNDFRCHWLMVYLCEH